MTITIDHVIAKLKYNADKVNQTLKKQLLAEHMQSDDTNTHDALMQRLSDSVAQGFIHKVVGAKLASMLYTVDQLRNDDIVHTSVSPGKNCILGFNCLKVKDNHAFREEIENLIKTDHEFNKDSVHDNVHQSVACIYDLFAAIGMIIEHTGHLHKIGRKFDQYDYLASIDNIKFDQALFSHNRYNMTEGMSPCRNSSLCGCIYYHVSISIPSY